VSPPADAREPRSGCDDGCTDQRDRDETSPAIEPCRGRARIEPASATDVLPGVLQDVHDGVPDLARRPEGVRMVSPVPHVPSAPQGAIDRLGDTDGETLHAVREPRWSIRFHEQGR